MANVFDDDIQTAIELIDLYGMDCLWQKPAPANGGVPGYPGAGTVPDPIPCRMAFFSARDLGMGSDAFMAAMVGTEVPMSGEIGLLAGGLSFTPETSDSFIRGGAEMAIEKIDRLAPNGLPILYYVTVTG